MPYLLNYTREPMDPALYDPKLAYSMHLAISQDAMKYQPLNHNSGVLFAKATANPDGSLNPKSIKNPFLFALPEHKYAIAAIRTDGDGHPDEESKGKILLFLTEDLLEYQEIGLITLGKEWIEQIACAYDKKSRQLTLFWRDQAGGCSSAAISRESYPSLCSAPLPCGKEAFYQAFHEAGVSLPAEIGIEGIHPHNAIKIPEETAARLQKKLLPPVNTSVFFPEQIKVSDPSQLAQYYADALYSDGTSAKKRVDWDLSGVNFSQPGDYEITGRVHQDHYAFPIAPNRADPCVFFWKQKYYFIATNDADGNHTLFIREADSIPELVNAKEHLLLDSTTYPGIGGLLWAPEFHEINGQLYLFHAATPGEFFWEESHVMKLKEGGNPICRTDWSAPKRVVKKDGSELCTAGREITLDMTCFAWQGEYYAVWSQRQFLPKDLGAWLFIAKLDPEEPWRLLTEPVILSKPEYGWANNHTFVDEGPFALIREDRLFLTFSSAAVDTSYVIGLLSIEKGKDLLSPSNWKKKNYPLLTSRSAEGEFGPGHNAYVTDFDGTVWNTYHARPSTNGVRSSGIRRVHFDIDGEPVLDLTEDLDLREEFSMVRTKIQVLP